MLGSKVTTEAAVLPVAPTLHALPEVCKLHILGFGTPRCALRLEVASRALDLRAVVRTAYDALWSGHLRERWPCEGPALCSLVGPQATARQLYEAFATRRVARSNVHGEVEQVAGWGDRLRSKSVWAYPDDEEESSKSSNDSDDDDYDPDAYAYPVLNRVVFILTVGGFARTARFTAGAKGEATPNHWSKDADSEDPYAPPSGLGRIQPGPSCICSWELRGGEALFDFANTFPPDSSLAEFHWDPEATEGITGNQLSQSFYAIDLQSLKCVSLFDGIYPDDIGGYADGRIYLRYFAEAPKLPVFFRHGEPVEYERTSDIGDAAVDVFCIGSASMDLEPCVDAGPFVYRLRHTNIDFRDNREGGYCVGDANFCPYLLDIIQQTHGA